MFNWIVPDRYRSRLRVQSDNNSDVDRVYVIGDVHGRLDLFGQLISLIKEDHAVRGPCTTRIIMIGDLVDRGPNSAALVEWCRVLTDSSDRFVVLKGNHEALMVQALDGDVKALAFWLQHGGCETLASWGISIEAFEGKSELSLISEARRVIGWQTLAWMDALPLSIRCWDYMVVHAGVRPGIALDQQAEGDLLWIRRPFLESEEDHGAVIIHGHTIHEGGPDIRSNRINIDTGAYKTGMLTAIGIQRGETWYLSTSPSSPSEQDKRLGSQAVNA